MARPSQNTDQLLLQSGRALLPLLGCRNLSARKLAEHAGVNLGMFHYHFRSKDNFIRILLQQFYEQMFAELQLNIASPAPTLERLRGALLVIAHFGRENHQVLTRIVADAISGEPLAQVFLRENMPRHLLALRQLIEQAQREQQIVDAALPQLLAFVTGAVLIPVLAGAFISDLARPRVAGGDALLPAVLGEVLQNTVLSDAAINQRIGFALRGLSRLSESL